MAWLLVTVLFALHLGYHASPTYSSHTDIHVKIIHTYSMVSRPYIPAYNNSTDSHLVTLGLAAPTLTL